VASAFVEETIVEVLLLDPNCPPEDLREIAANTDFEALAKEKGYAPKQAASALYIAWSRIARVGTCNFCGRVFRSALRRTAWDKRAERPREKAICPTCYREAQKRKEAG
jgi:hypothetical protein